MTATATTTQPRFPSAPAGGELVFRVYGPASHGRVVRLKSPKCTIGAARDCTLRLRTVGVAPLHCLVLRGPAGAVVRRLSPDTLLNHGAFADAPLKSGDRLGLGPIELEVLGIGAEARQSPRIETTDAERAEPDARLDELDARGRELDEQHRRRLAEQEETRRELDEQHSLLDARAAELDTRQNALAEELNRLRNEQKSLAEQRDALRAEQNTLTEQRDALQAEHKSLAEERDALRAEQNSLTEQRDTLQAEQKALADERDTLQAEQNTLAEQRRQWESDRLQSPQNGGFQREESSDGQPQTACREESDEKAHPTTERREVDFHTPSEKSPVDLAEVFHRVGGGLDSSEQASDQSRRATESPSRVEPSEAPREESSPDEAENESHEESIDEYMRRLMQQVRGSSDGSEPRAVDSSKSAASSGAASIEETERKKPSTASAARQTRRQAPEGLPPRVAPPEKRGNLSAMRELANLSAQTALSRHTRRVLTGAMYSKLLVALVALAAAAVLMWIWKTTGWRLTYYSSLVALLTAIYWGLEYAIVSGRLAINKTGGIVWKSPSEKQNDGEAPAEKAEESSGKTASSEDTCETASGE